MDSTPSISFIGIVDFSQEARWIYMTDSVTDLLGYEPHELRGRPSMELVHPDEISRVRQLHYETIRQDKAAVLVYLRMKHKDPYKGYILCGISRTVVHNVLVGSVSFASPGAKALHNASTAQEITVISPTPHDLEFRRWHDPSPMPPSPIPPALQKSPKTSNRSRSSSHSDSTPSPEPQEQPMVTYDPLPSQSFRTAFILNRFSVNCTIMYCSNDLLVSTNDANNRSFFDFVAKKDEDVVRSWIDVIKGWGVNERGQPSDGGFGFGRFTLLAEGRDSLSVARTVEPTPSRHRHGSAPSARVKPHKSSTRTVGSNSSTPTRPARASSNADGDSPTISVDAIFSAHSDGLMVIIRRAT